MPSDHFSLYVDLALPLPLGSAESIPLPPPSQGAGANSGGHNGGQVGGHRGGGGPGSILSSAMPPHLGQLGGPNQHQAIYFFVQKIDIIALFLPFPLLGHKRPLDSHACPD